MGKPKNSLSLLGLGISIGVVLVVILVFVVGAIPKKIIIGPVEFEIPNATPQAQPQAVVVATRISSSPTAQQEQASTSKLKLLLNEKTSRYTEPDGSNMFGYRVPEVWAQYISQAGLIPLGGSVSVDLEFINQECFGQYTQETRGACTIGEQLAWDCKVAICTLQYNGDPQYCSLEYCKWFGN